MIFHVFKIAKQTFHLDGFEEPKKYLWRIELCKNVSSSAEVTGYVRRCTGISVGVREEELIKDILMKTESQCN